jgi:putative aldouronate transport system permease protein
MKKLKTTSINNKKSLLDYLKQDYIFYLLLLVPMLYYLIFHYVPMYGAIIAFKDYNIFKGTFKSEWVGLAVFKEIFQMKEFYQVLRNTFMLNVLDLILSFPAPIILALVLNEVKKGLFKKSVQTIAYLPHFISWVIIGGMVYQIFSTKSGYINTVLQFVGFNPVPFLTDKVWWLFTYLISGIWQSVGWGAIIYLAALSGIDKELYDAAEVDGCGRIKKIWHITLPGIKPTIVILLILNIGNMIRIGFERPFILGNVLVQDYSDVLSTFVYRVGLKSGRYSLSTAVGLFQSVIGFIMVISANAISKKVNDTSIW